MSKPGKVNIPKDIDDDKPALDGLMGDLADIESVDDLVTESMSADEVVKTNANSENSFTLEKEPDDQGAQKGSAQEPVVSKTKRAETSKKSQEQKALPSKKNGDFVFSFTKMPDAELGTAVLLHHAEILRINLILFELEQESLNKFQFVCNAINKGLSNPKRIKWVTLEEIHGANSTRTFIYHNEAVRRQIKIIKFNSRTRRSGYGKNIQDILRTMVLQEIVALEKSLKLEPVSYSDDSDAVLIPYK